MAEEKSPTSSPASTVVRVVETAPQTTKPKPLPPWNVVLLDDNDHTYDYVILMLGKVCGHSKERAFKMAKEVDKSGRVIVYTAHKELAELKRDQILAFGADPLLSRSSNSMKAIIELALG